VETEPNPLENRPKLAKVVGTVPGVRWLVAAIVAVTLACALLARVIAREDFPTIGKALWWAAQTVTTVGYGDVTPVTTPGRFVAAILMIAGFATLSLVTASISAGYVNRLQQRRRQDELDALLETLHRIEQRLDRLEQLERRSTS
jgi:voltage-gated potassium channel